MAELDYDIWLELRLTQDSTKAVSARSSTQILDYMGDVGGFQGSLIIVLYLIGEYFSSKLLSAAIAETFYLSKSGKNNTSAVAPSFEGGEIQKQKFREDYKN
jgi:hypothetical protein